MHVVYYNTTVHCTVHSLPGVRDLTHVCLLHAYCMQYEKATYDMRRLHGYRHDVIDMLARSQLCYLKENGPANLKWLDFMARTVALEVSFTGLAWVCCMGYTGSHGLTNNLA